MRTLFEFHDSFYRFKVYNKYDYPLLFMLLGVVEFLLTLILLAALIFGLWYFGTKTLSRLQHMTGSEQLSHTSAVDTGAGPVLSENGSATAESVPSNLPESPVAAARVDSFQETAGIKDAAEIVHIDMRPDAGAAGDTAQTGTAQTSNSEAADARATYEQLRQHLSRTDQPATRVPTTGVQAQPPPRLAAADQIEPVVAPAEVADSRTDGNAVSQVANVSEPAIAAASDIGSIRDGNWLLRQKNTDFTIQLGSTSNLPFLRSFAERLPDGMPVSVYHYRTRNDGDKEYGLAAGVFASRSEATRAAENLPSGVRRYKPWVRRVGDIQLQIKNR